MREVNVIVTIVVKDSSKSAKARSMMMAPW